MIERNSCDRNKNVYKLYFIILCIFSLQVLILLFIAIKIFTSYILLFHIYFLQVFILH